MASDAACELTSAGKNDLIRLLGQANEKIRQLKAEDLVDDLFVRKFEKDGFDRAAISISYRCKRFKTKEQNLTLSAHSKRSF